MPLVIMIKTKTIKISEKISLFFDSKSDTIEFVCIGGKNIVLVKIKKIENTIDKILECFDLKYFDIVYDVPANC